MDALMTDDIFFLFSQIVGNMYHTVVRSEKTETPTFNILSVFLEQRRLSAHKQGLQRGFDTPQ